jgi:hypothetical protein
MGLFGEADLPLIMNYYVKKAAQSKKSLHNRLDGCNSHITVMKYMRQ